jgi:hypothetical protein
MKATKIMTIGAIALALSFGATALAHAQAGRPSPLPPEDRPTLKERADMKREAAGIPEKIENRKAALADATTTRPFKRDAKEVRAAMQKRMEVKQFEARKNALLKELGKAVEHLNDIVSRIESRIAKAESEGRDMSEPKTLLVTAKTKVEAAKTAVDALKNLTATSTGSTGTTTPEVDLTKPRQIGDAAIKSVKEARDSLQKVVVSIAKNMGLKTGQNATSTPPRGQKPKPPVTGTTTPPTATSTATTTGN